MISRMGVINDTDHKDPTEEEIKKWQENPEELSKKVLMRQITLIMWSLI